MVVVVGESKIHLVRGSRHWRDAWQQHRWAAAVLLDCCSRDVAAGLLVCVLFVKIA